MQSDTNVHFRQLAGINFQYRPAIRREHGVTRRDPSPVIDVDGTYHTWYSKNVAGNIRPSGGFTATVWHATSDDGVRWQEREEAIGRGPEGSFDECGVYTPTICTAAGKYYLYYTAMPAEWKQGQETTQSAIGVAVAESPFGPWTKSEQNPILECSDDPRDFDSLRVDDTCILARDGGYWMYYKGREWDPDEVTTKMGLARTDDPLGPWTKHPDNPVLNSGHEVCVWPHGGGVASLVCDAGPQGNTLQYSENGVDFWMAQEALPPKAPGPYRSDGFTGGAGPGIDWGLCIGGAGTDWPFLLRFDCELLDQG